MKQYFTLKVVLGYLLGGCVAGAVLGLWEQHSHQFSWFKIIFFIIWITIFNAYGGYYNYKKQNERKAKAAEPADTI